jgi:hypothetical protein
MSKKRRSEFAEVVKGRYFQWPLSVADSAAFLSCGHMAKSLIFEMLRQLNGSNNGHIKLSRSWLSSRGWRSVDSINRARDELLEAGIIVQTRHGGLRNGSHKYAVSWLPITDWRGLDITPQEYHPGAYLLPRQKQNGCPTIGQGKPVSSPTSGQGEKSPSPTSGQEKAIFEGSPSPTIGHNLEKPFPPAKRKGVGSSSLAAAGSTLTTGGLE